MEKHKTRVHINELCINFQNSTYVQRTVQTVCHIFTGVNYFVEFESHIILCSGHQLCIFLREYVYKKFMFISNKLCTKQGKILWIFSLKCTNCLRVILSSVHMIYVVFHQMVSRVMKIFKRICVQKLYVYSEFVVYKNR